MHNIHTRDKELQYWVAWYSSWVCSVLILPLPQTLALSQCCLFFLSIISLFTLSPSLDSVQIMDLRGERKEIQSESMLRYSDGRKRRSEKRKVKVGSILDSREGRTFRRAKRREFFPNNWESCSRITEWLGSSCHYSRVAHSFFMLKSKDSLLGKKNTNWFSKRPSRFLLFHSFFSSSSFYFVLSQIQWLFFFIPYSISLYPYTKNVCGFQFLHSSCISIFPG